MEYLMFVATDTDPEPEGTGGITVEEWVEEGERRGIRKQGQRLRPPEDATTVRVRKGELLVTDGPFIETREQMAGYFLIEARDRDEAVAIAGRVPGARIGTVEVRPVREITGLPE